MPFLKDGIDAQGRAMLMAFSNQPYADFAADDADAKRWRALCNMVAKAPGLCCQEVAARLLSAQNKRPGDDFVAYMDLVFATAAGLQKIPAPPVIQDPTAQGLHQVWMEGYRATGEHRHAEFLGSAEAQNFPAACLMIGPGAGSDFNAESMTIWGCRLFNNEADARKAFG